MNYKGSYKDLFTLAHEAGHSMHSYLSKNRQPYPIADYPIFLAEVASTFNEELLFQHLLKSTKDEKKRIFLLTQKLDDIRATFFRQTLFAEFELKTHMLLEQQTPLTPELLNSLYRELTEFYFGPTLTFDGHAEVEWARIPHFYYQLLCLPVCNRLECSSPFGFTRLQGWRQRKGSIPELPIFWWIELSDPLLKRLASI